MTNQKFLSGALGIGVGLLLGAILMLLQGYNPLTTYGALFDYSLGGLYPLATTLRTAVPLILTGLSASVAFAAGPVKAQPAQADGGGAFYRGLAAGAVAEGGKDSQGGRGESEGSRFGDAWGGRDIGGAIGNGAAEDIVPIGVGA